MEVNQIICGDCLEIMKAWPAASVDFIITDPPYGVRRDEGFEGFGGFGGFGKPIARKKYANSGWDDKRLSQEYIDLLLKLGRKVLIFGGNFYADILPQGKHWVVWDKLNTMPSFGDCELIWTNIDRKSVKKITYEWNGLIGKEKIRIHPTQKPEILLRLIISQYTQPNDLILDPFCGSGTTCVAAALLDRRYIGIDISEEYCQLARKRIKEATAQQRLFAGI